MYIDIKIENTYAWIIATANSNKIKIIRIIEGIPIILIVFVNRPIIICPAVRLAASRTDSVIGRINCLIVSIRTINWDKKIGVDNGTRCLNIWVIFLVIIKIINPIQNGILKDKEHAIWEDRVKM